MVEDALGAGLSLVARRTRSDHRLGDDEERNRTITDVDSHERGAKLEELAAEVGPMAFGIAFGMLGDRASAEDALQDAYLQAYRGLSDFRGDASLRTWFVKIVVNSCKRHRVVWRRWTRASSQLALMSPDDVKLSWDEISDPALRQRLRAAVAKLPHRQRTAFVLRYIEDLGIRETAEIMGCAPGTVKATIHKAVVKLRRELGDAV